MFYLFLFTLTAAVGEYLFFNQTIDAQRRTILVLTNQNDSLKSKVNKNQDIHSLSDIKYMNPIYKNGYTTDNCTLYLIPLLASPVVYKCTRPIKVNVTFLAEVSKETWYEVLVTVNGAMLKGWLKEADIKLVVEEATK